MALSKHPYADFLYKVRKPARYLGGERFSVVKDWDAVRLRFCLAFPDLYDVGMSHLGTKILYALVNARPEFLCERAFAPWPDLERELRAHRLPLAALESARPLCDFDVLGFSLQYELTYTNVLNLLDLAGLPLRAADRGPGEPLVIAGGPGATHPEPLAPFVDAFLIGDAEELLPRSLELLADLREEGVPRREVLRRLAALGGWYCPALYAVRREARGGLTVVDGERSAGPYPVRRAPAVSLATHPFPEKSPVPMTETVFERLSVEIARGCQEGCRFCQAGMIYRPVRERNPLEIAATVERAATAGGYHEAALTGLSPADYSCIGPLVRKVAARLRTRMVGLSVSSLRAYGLDEELLEEIARVKATGLTFAPEAGTQRMRDVVNKNVSEDDLLRTTERVFSRGWSRVKLYFMIGLPTETDEDVRGIVETAAKVRDLGRKLRGRRAEVTASVSTFVPKPHTPFQWAAQDSAAETSRKQKMLREAADRRRLTLKYHDAEASLLEGLISRGDRRVGDLLEAAWRRGCRFDGWTELFNREAWRAALVEWGVSPDSYRGALPLDTLLPWSHIHVGLETKFLKREREKALAVRTSPPCGRPRRSRAAPGASPAALTEERKPVCHHCGFDCDLEELRCRREEFLRATAAWSSPAPTERPVSSGASGRGKKASPQPPVRPEEGTAHRFRLTFTKLGTAAFLGHLDLTRLLPRTARRAGLPLKHSRGFKPHPLLSFGPPLPLGTAGLTEVCDMNLTADIPPEEVLRRLNEAADRGVCFKAAEKLAPEARHCGRVYKLAEYLLAAPNSWSREGLAAAVCRVIPAALRVGGADVAPADKTAGETEAGGDAGKNGGELFICVHRQGKEKRLNILAGVSAVRVDVPTAEEATALDLPSTTVPVLRYAVDLNEGEAVRPEYFARGLLDLEEGEWPPGFVAARTSLRPRPPRVKGGK